MNIREIYDRLDSFDEEERVRFLGGLTKIFTHLSTGTLRDFQNNWDGTKTPEEFFAAQAVEFKFCIELEISEVGQIVRKSLGLKPLNWDTIIE